MLFNSGVFIVFFLIFFFVYWASNKYCSLKVRNALLVVASYVFYGWWDWRFLGLIAFSSLCDYLIGLRLEQESKAAIRKYWLYLSLIVNLGILGFFKYCDFFVQSLVDGFGLFGVELSYSSLNIILPVGISFYTFQTMSYTIDIYRKQLKVTSDPFVFFAFVSFFPQLVAGPIERASCLLDQFKKKYSFNYHEVVAGLRLVLWGLFKKVVIADNFGLLVDQLYASDEKITGPAVLLGGAFFALQIYADFSGYSDIAIGLSRMMGFELMTNFQTPYFATSFQEFWQRWHISLSTWFRDYVYIPLGGNRSGKYRSYFNLWFTFLVSGLWHGASINFVIWGAFHGFLLIAEKQFQLTRLKQLYIPIVLIGVILLWVPFRAADPYHFKLYFTQILDFSSYSLDGVLSVLNSYSMNRFFWLMVVLASFLLLEFSMQKRDFHTWVVAKPKAIRFGLYYLLFLAIVFIGNYDVKPSFIYFQF